MEQIERIEHPDFFALTPQQKVDKAAEMAKVLQKVVEQANLAKNLGGKKKHLEYEAWQTIGQFFGATPATEWTHPITDDGKIVGYEARVQVFNADGRVIGAAENMCMRDEKNWKDKPNYALRSMAQTRAASKALRSVFAFVAVLAGYEATPLEEMDGFQKEEPKPKEDIPSLITPKTIEWLQAKCKENMVGWETFLEYCLSLGIVDIKEKEGGGNEPDVMSMTIENCRKHFLNEFPNLKAWKVKQDNK